MKLFSKKFQEILKKTQINEEKFSHTVIVLSLLFSVLLTLLFALLLFLSNSPLYYAGFVFIFVFIIVFTLVKSIPQFTLKSKKSMLESDLLYSVRHLVLKLESGSSLLNSIESVSKLKTNSSNYFKQLVFDVSLGVPIEEALSKAMEYSPSKAYSKILQEIKTSLTTGSDLQNTLKNTLEDITKSHLIHIQEYGKKLNPMSMFYMILGTILPSLGTAMLIVGSSLMPGILIIDMRILFFMAALLLVVQVFFVLAFRSLKPAVME